MGNKVKFLVAKEVETIEDSINSFCETHEVYATQFIPNVKDMFVVAVWYRPEVVKI